MADDLSFERRLAGLGAEARSRVENALKEALAKEGALAAFDRSGFDRGPYDRGGSEIRQPIDEIIVPEKGPISKK